jgi:hypothetical protein
MATDTTIAAIGGSQRKIVVLMTINLLGSNDDMLALHLATRACTAPDGYQYFSAIKDPGVVAQPGSYLSSDVNLCSCSPTLVMEAHASGGKTVRELLDGSWLWVGSEVIMSVWEMTTGELAQTLHGSIQSVAASGGVLTVAVRQRVDWNAPVAITTATRERFPNLPDDTVGAALPRMWGRFQNSPARPPTYTTDYPFSNALERIRSARRATSGILVEPGRGDGAATVMFSGHKLHSLGSQAGATSPFLYENDKLNPLVGCTVFNEDNGAGILVPDNSAVGRYAALPDAFRVIETYTPTTANNHACLYDPWNEQSYCRVYAMLDQFSRVIFRLGAVPEEVTGKDGVSVTAATLLVVARCCGLVNFGVSFVKYSDATTFSNNTIQLAAGNVLYDSNDEYELFTLDCTAFVTGANAANLADMGVAVGQYVSGSYFGRGWADISAIAVELTFKPQQQKMGEERHVLVTKTRPTSRWGHGGGSYQVWDTLPPEQQLQGKFYSNLIGYADDGSGTYTGTALAPIERPCDIARHMLTVIGGQTASQIETGDGVLGSFTDARRLLTTWRGGDIVLALQVDDDTDVMTALARIAANSWSSISLDPASDKWRFVPWLADPAITRERAISLTQFIGTPTIGLTPDSRLSTNVRVTYGYDSASSTYLHETSLSPGSSGAGWKYLNQNDQSIATIAGATDKMDFLVCPSSGAASYTSGNTTVTRATGSFITDDGFYLGATIWSDRPGIPANTTINGFGGTPYGKTMTINHAPTASTGSWPAMLALMGTITLNAGDLSMDGWMDALQTALRPTLSQTSWFARRRWAFAFGGHPRWRCNVIWYRDEGVVRGTGFTPPDTADDSVNSMELIAATLQTNMNGQGTTGWEVTYDRSTHRFTIHNATRHFQLLFGTCNPDNAEYWNYNGCCSLGFPPIDLDDTSNPNATLRNHTYTSTFAVEEGQFMLGCDVGFKVLWRNGANGQLYHNPPLTPYSALGFSPHDDTLGWSTLVSGCVMKGLRQKALAIAQRRYLRSTGDGPARRPYTIEGRDIFDTDTAVEVRNRAADLFSRPHVEVSGLVEGVFGIARGEVVTFDEDMAALMPYPAPDSDGLWAGKKFYIVEVRQHQGPDNLASEIVAVSV